ncbi:YjcZ family sporulation protein [Pseudalkalibacillus decolorationis]|nr:YjcZ family sporulation protein [Pseudalkalibacillus decolorationis]
MHHGYGHGGYDCHDHGQMFAIIVVLFILLIIVGAAGFVGRKDKDCK